MRKGGQLRSSFVVNLLQYLCAKNIKLEVHSVERIYHRQGCFDASKPCVAAASTGALNTSTWDFPDVIKFHVAVYTTQNHATLLRRAPNTDFPDVIKFRVAVHTLWK